MSAKENSQSIKAASAKWYLAFSEWQIERHLKQPRKSVRFFKQSHNHALIWALVMRGHYMSHAPSFGDCIHTAACSIETARKIILTAQAKGYFELRSDPSDSRRKRVHPTDLCIREYESHVSMFLSFPSLLKEINERSVEPHHLHPH